MSLVLLNFHGVGPVSRSVDEEERACWLDHRFFDSVLDLVRDHNHVGLTVDDGNESDYSYILPALLRRNMRAAFFVCSGRLDKPTFLSRTQVRELLAQGMEIGSHGVDHVSWRRLSPESLDRELGRSRSTLEGLCNRPILTASCPLGDYNRTVLRGVRKAGYTEIYTSDDGICREQDWIRARNTVTQSMTLDSLEHLIHRSSTTFNQTLVNVRKLVKRLR
jgi:peptidoglycan/xylan/chitin deacetylase (PgdA/CDA1 family)